MPATFNVLAPQGVNELLLYFGTIDLGSEITDFDPGKKKLTFHALSFIDGLDFLTFELKGKFNKDGTSGMATDIWISQMGISQSDQDLIHISGANLDIAKLIKRNDAELGTGEVLQGRVFPLLFGHGNDMVMNGSESQDVLISTGGKIFGRGGDDVFFETSIKAVTRYDGGNGSDTVSYLMAPDTGLKASLFNAGLNTSWASDDRYINIDNLFGSKGNDTLEGNDGANTLEGGDGNDILIGRGGADKLIGGAGTDLASYETASSTSDGAGVAVVMSNISESTRDAAGDTFDGIEGIIGSNFMDIIVGDAQNNILKGGGGDDFIGGGDGTDELWGDGETFGVDGDDTFVFLGPARGVKNIMDFDVFDHIQLSRSGFGLHPLYKITEGSTLIIADNNPVALTNSPTFLVEKSSGRLLFDADGNGSGTTELIANVKFHSQQYLDANDFMIFG
jgi:Ca2+-binding RTX toxin-like protein